MYDIPDDLLTHWLEDLERERDGKPRLIRDNRVWEDIIRALQEDSARQLADVRKELAETERQLKLTQKLLSKKEECLRNVDNLITETRKHLRSEYDDSPAYRRGAQDAISAMKRAIGAKQ